MLHLNKLPCILAALAVSAVLLGITVLADFRETAEANKPIRISAAELSAGAKISLGPRQAEAGEICTASVSWSDGQLTLLCGTPDGETEEYPLESGSALSFHIPKSGLYTVAVQSSGGTARSVKGIIGFAPPHALPEEWEGAVVYQSAELRRYSGGAPYIHDIRTNGTGREIVSSERGMAAYDADGAPLKLFWNALDSSAGASYTFLYDWDSERIPAGGTSDIFGGWSLDLKGEDPAAEKIAYVLYCDKTIAFADGTVWENPAYDEWLENCAGRQMPVETLASYYPLVQKVE